jgi:hypothetical protein
MNDGKDFFKHNNNQRLLTCPLPVATITFFCSTSQPLGFHSNKQAAILVQIVHWTEKLHKSKM